MFQIDKRIVYVFLAICVVSMLMQYISSPSALLSLLLTVPGVLIAMTFHEFAHAFAAYKLGDDTAKTEGRLTLNPLSHLDPIGIIMLLFLGFGWGKPVRIDSRNFNRNMSAEKAEAIVAVAGPVANIIVAIIVLLIRVALIKSNVLVSADIRVSSTIYAVISYTLMLNIGLALFNMIPLPPLDGSKVLMPFLPFKAKMWFRENEYMFYIAFLILWITGIAGAIISPAITWSYKGLINLTNIIFKI